MSKVILREGREKSLLQKHPWIFSGAILTLPDSEAGAVLPVYSSSGKFLAKAYFHPTNSIAGRVLTFQDESIEDAIAAKMRKALALRKTFFDQRETNAYRLINAEGDGLPGLIVDCYDNLLVVQIATCGMERLRSLIIDNLVALLNPLAIYEKSTASARMQEGLEKREGFVYGAHQKEVRIIEHGMHFHVKLDEAQKTGLFLDQRERRKEVEKLSFQRRVLNCFSYTGGFSLFALRGGAQFVHSVDSCHSSMKQAEYNLQLNNLSRHSSFVQDAFSFLKSSEMHYDLIILDPPAFAKKRSDITAACHGYKTINRFVMEKALPGTLVLTCSCSYFIDEKLFQSLLFQAAQETGREIQILNGPLHGVDHPISLYHPEGRYLKSFLLYISA